ncbi:molybdenum cofactor biosynthesis prote [Rhodotorula sp. JG-1b]|nr:molybdenum cofactor biosynthesis prote [Rhodotorula sp. JG-1b]
MLRSLVPRWTAATLNRGVSTDATALATATDNNALRVTHGHGSEGSPHLLDSFGRRHDYLRISLTEKCNLRCTYCMPEHGVPLLPSEHRLTADEIDRVARVFVRNGIRKIRLTGGEPTIRPDLVEIVERISMNRQAGLTSLGLTSNGIALKRKLPALVDAGLSHLNLSLDTLDPFKYELMTRRRGFERVVESLELAQSLKPRGLRQTKINVVVIRGVNDQEVADFVNLTRDMDITVRFIEYMPFEDNRWSTQKLVPSATLLSHLETLHPRLVKLRDAESDTTRAYAVPGWKGSFGFISSMTDHFCGTCSRLRIGADGGVKVCLFGPPVLSLRPLLRGTPSTTTALSNPNPLNPTTAAPLAPATDDQLMAAVDKALYGKKWAHNGLGGASGIHERGKMGPMVSYPTFADNVGRVSPSWPRIALTRATLHSHRSARPATPTNATTPPARDRLTHIDPRTGKASMVSVSEKAATKRTATASGEIYLGERAFSLIDLGGGGGGGGDQGSTHDIETRRPPTLRTKKGDVLTIAQIAGIMSSKHTSLLIPLCHPLSLSHISVTFYPLPARHALRIEATAECVGPTGVEMEALTAVSVAALTVWDMCKAVAGQEMEIGRIRVTGKSGGKSGDWVRSEEMG